MKYTDIDVFLPCIRLIIAKRWNIFLLLLSFFACYELFQIPTHRHAEIVVPFSVPLGGTADEAVHRQVERLQLGSAALKKNKLCFSLHGEGGMGGHVMLPLENLSLELPNGEVVLGHDNNISTLQGWHKHHSLVYSVHAMVHWNGNWYNSFGPVLFQRRFHISTEEDKRRWTSS